MLLFRFNFTQTTETMSYIVIKRMQVGKIDIF